MSTLVCIYIHAQQQPTSAVAEEAGWDGERKCDRTAKIKDANYTNNDTTSKPRNLPTRRKAQKVDSGDGGEW